jgi:hypothetical protein
MSGQRVRPLHRGGEYALLLICRHCGYESEG